MEERGNKTIMCSVLFLDIVEYSKKSVAGQISLKDRFNSYLSAAIRDVPMTDRIILDTGNGAAINFLGDVEDALKAALSLRESLLNEEPDVDPPLLVRMGINLGPVRLVRDINNQPNIVGDGINVAQRVMGFADAAQILVSRSYFDAVSRLSPQYAGMFHYQGSRTDKHVREHEVYAIGYPGDKTTLQRTSSLIDTERAEITITREVQRAKAAWRSAATKLDALIEPAIIRYQQADTQQRVLYAAVVAVMLLLFIVILSNLARHGEVPTKPSMLAEQQASTSKAGLPVEPDSPAPAASDKTKESIQPHSSSAPKPKIKNKAGSKVAKETPKAKPEHSENQAKIIDNNKIENKAALVTASGNQNTYISVACVEGTEVFIDGISKGRMGSSPLKVEVSPGKHTVIVSLTSRGIFTQGVEVGSGKTAHIKPGPCN
jgi:hypothetical protein